MHKEKFMIYQRDAKKDEATYSLKSHSAPHFEGHYVEGMEEWASWYFTMTSSNVSSPLLQQNIMVKYGIH